MGTQESQDLIRVEVRVEGCCGHAQCAAFAPEAFELDEYGYNSTPTRLLPRRLLEPAVRGASACPEQVITVTELPAPSGDASDASDSSAATATPQRGSR